MDGLLLGLVIGLAIILIGGGLYLTRRLWLAKPGPLPGQAEGNSSPIGTWLSQHLWLPIGRFVSHPFVREARRKLIAQGPPALEAGLIVAWAMWVGRGFLNLDPLSWPVGGDWALNTQVYFPWAWLRECGACVLWNSAINGGVPTMVQMVGAVAHPLVVSLILLFGVVNGTKLTFVAALALAGLAQWWLAKVLRLGFVPRMWSALLVVVGGHLTGRMDSGLIEEVLSAASCALVLPPLLELAYTGKKRSAAVAGVLLGLALLAGQAYMQTALVVGILPAFLVLLLNEQFQLKSAWKNFVWVGVIGLLVCTVFWLPFLHFSSNFVKPTDPAFSQSQSLAYLPLNLVIRDPQFFRLTILKNHPYPAWFVNYISWVPVILALMALALIPKAGRRTVGFFVTGIVLVYLLSSAVALRWLAVIWPTFASDFRTPTVMSSMAVPLIMALAAWGLDELLKFNRFRINLTSVSQKWLEFNPVWIVLIPLAWAILSAYDFSANWLNIEPGMGRVYPVLRSVAPAQTQWLQPPSGETFFALATADLGLKEAQTTSPWAWKEHVPPPAHIELTRDNVDTTSPNYLGNLDGLNIVVHPENEYAEVEAGDQLVPCRASGLGGNIDVECDQKLPGILTVYENQWSGWEATLDDAPVPLGPGQWLNVQASAGRHYYRFRYRPWDVGVGLSMMLAGIILAVVLWIRADPHPN